MLQAIHLTLRILGTVLPLSQFVPFLLDNGLDISLFAEQIFANRISASAWMDVIITSIVFWVFVFHEGTRWA